MDCSYIMYTAMDTVLLWFCQVGKEFDALLIDVLAPDPDTPVFDIFEPTSFEVRFLYAHLCNPC